MNVLGSENVANNISKYIRNSDNLKSWTCDNLVYSLSHEEKCYTVSLSNHYTKYPYDELKVHFYNFSYTLVSIFVWCATFFLKINRVIFVNNLFLSTNLYPNGFWRKNISNVKFYESYPTVIRSILDPKIFEEYGFVRIISRHVNIMNSTTIPKKKLKKVNTDINRLKNLLNDGYTIESYQSQPTLPHTEKNFDEIDENMLQRFKFCYNSLYSEKYSKSNPDFTTEWIKLFMSYPSTGLLWIKDPCGEIQAILGYYKVDNVTTASLFGYNTNVTLPTKYSYNYTLYSSLSTLIYMENIRLGTIGHYSGGCKDYKKQRGAVSHLEYIMVYYKHLPLYQKIHWMYLHFLTIIVEIIYKLFIRDV